MLLEDFEYHVQTSKCDLSATRLGATAEFEGDVSCVFPYLNGACGQTNRWHGAAGRMHRIRGVGPRTTTGLVPMTPLPIDDSNESPLAYTCSLCVATFRPLPRPRGRILVRVDAK